MLKEQLKEQQLKEEEEERKRIREQTMMFKAHGIRKYKPIDSKVNEKALTVPQAPVFATSARATLKDDIFMKAE